MIQVEITDQMLCAARKKAVEMGKLYKSITRGQGNLAGFIGEFIAQKVMGGKVENTYDYDLVLDDGTKVDAKTKRTSVEPLEEYDCSIATSTRIQDCDMYAFVRVKNDYSVGWFLGVKSKKDFFSEATEYKKGDKDESNNFTFRSDCFNIKIAELDKSYE